MSIKNNTNSEVQPFRLGARIRVTRDIDLSPYTIVRAGELGTVVYVGAEETDIEMDLTHAGLHQWHNCIWIIAGGETEDVRTALELLPKLEAIWTRPQSDYSACSSQLRAARRR